ncbi:MAG: Flp pilus assembly complex ATPase component TadA, partial [Planctomycetales bacterium]|nr:Flp pilus assembly complex ATPase component TadA [Planctomycetales bacterium]
MTTNALPPPEEEMNALLVFMGKHTASDLHLKVGYPPFMRIGGQLRRIESPPLPDSSYVEQMLLPLIPRGRIAEYEQHGDLDFSAHIENGDRFRINMFRSGDNTHAAIRRVQSRIPDFKELHLPDVYRDTIMHAIEGLILVCGVTGSGKSSTLAAMLD